MPVGRIVYCHRDKITSTIHDTQNKGIQTRFWPDAEKHFNKNGACGDAR
jgi:hypothetical protein